jgi:hypothetical protein
MKKILFLLCLGLAANLIGAPATFVPNAIQNVTARQSGTLVSPTNFFTANLASPANIGSGVGIANAQSGLSFPFKSFVAAGFATVATNGTNITITGTQSGETNTYSSLGASNATVKALTTTKSGVNFPFLSVEAGANVSLSLTSTSLVVAASAAATNANTFTITTTDFVINTYYTNVAQRASVSASIVLTTTATEAAQVALYVDQDGSGAFEQTGITVKSDQALAATNTYYVAAYLQPSARFLFTNLSVGSAVGAIGSGSCQWVQH